MAEIEMVGLEVKAEKPEDLLARANALGEELRALVVSAKKLPKDKGLDAHQDPGRALSLAQVNLQTGLMWLRKAIQCPKEF